MRKAGAAFLALLAGVWPARADVVSAKPDSVGVTFYHDEAVATSMLRHPDRNPWIRDQGIAFVSERRSIDLPAGPVVVKFRGVAATMVPQTADIQGLPAGALERNFDYDLLTPGALLAKSIGETVTLVRTDPKTGARREDKAIVRSGPDGAVLEIAGRFEALHCSGLPEKLVFDRVPEGLADEPTLSVRLDVPRAGHYAVTLSYIATGLNWSADYVARLEPGTDKLDLSGWLTLANFSASSFANAPVEVVAGRLSTTGGDKPVEASALMLATHCWPMDIDWATHRPPPPPPPPPPPMYAPMAMRAPSESVTVTAEKRIEARQFGDYKLYPLPEPTTVAAQQTKQVQFLDQRDVPYEKVYRLDIDRSFHDVFVRPDVILRLHNDEASGLGKPLPAGQVAVFEPGADGELLFVGQSAVDDLAVGLPVEIDTGATPRVRALPRLVSTETHGSGRDLVIADSWDIDFENDNAAPAVFELRQDLYDGRARIETETQAHAEAHGRAVWTITLPPRGSAALRYRISHPN